MIGFWILILFVSTLSIMGILVQFCSCPKVDSVLTSFESEEKCQIKGEVRVN